MSLSGSGITASRKAPLATLRHSAPLGAFTRWYVPQPMTRAEAASYGACSFVLNVRAESTDDSGAGLRHCAPFRLFTRVRGACH